MTFYIDSTYGTYMVDSENEKDAISKVCNYEQTIYDSWASSVETDDGEIYDDPYPEPSDFEIISHAQFNRHRFYKDLVNYDFSKLQWGTECFCEQKENEDYCKMWIANMWNGNSVFITPVKPELIPFTLSNGTTINDFWIDDCCILLPYNADVKLLGRQLRPLECVELKIDEQWMTT